MGRVSDEVAVFSNHMLILCVLTHGALVSLLELSVSEYGVGPSLWTVSWQSAEAVYR